MGHNEIHESQYNVEICTGKCVFYEQESLELVAE